jgi:hypothetical protein
VNITLDGSNDRRIALSVPEEGNPSISVTGDTGRILGKMPNQ